MRRLFTVIDFELKNYTQNKSFMVTTILMAVLLFGASFLPRVVNLSSMTGVETESLFGGADDEEETGDTGDEGECEVCCYCDDSGLIVSEEVFADVFPNVDFKQVKDRKTVSETVEKGEAKAGFYLKDAFHYDYFVENSEMFDDTQMIFEEVFTGLRKQAYLAEHGLDGQEFMEQYEAPCEGELIVLGKDASENYWYCYALVIVIFMLIIMYGVMIATAVTNEKSNRSIEVLVTSIDAKYLLFGKVFAGALAVVVQTGSILAAVLAGYHINREAWGNKLDAVLHIPSEVLITFAVFGVGGFLFYAFAYGAVGALVSKTEDINKVAGTVQMVIMAVYFVVLFTLNKPDGIVMKVCSFLPVSSYSAMFVRIAMGKVSMPEIVLSAVLLYASIFFMGWLGAKIYRMGTLRYGNPIKITNALKSIRQKD